MWTKWMVNRCIKMHHFNRFVKVACVKLVLFCLWLPSVDISITVSIIACILDFNNGVEYYQTVNTLITRLVLWLFDNSIFHSRSLCLTPSYTQMEEQQQHSEGNHCCYFLFPQIFRIFFYLIRPATLCDWGFKELLVERDILINIFHLFSKLWAKIRWPPQQDSSDFGFPARPVRHAHTPVPGRRRREGELVPE